MIASSVTELAPIVGTRTACAALAVARATHYRRRRGPRLGPPAPRPSPVRALSEAERAAVLELLHAERFVDASLGAVVATQLPFGRASAIGQACLSNWSLSNWSLAIAGQSTYSGAHLRGVARRGLTRDQTVEPSHRD